MAALHALVPVVLDHQGFEVLFGNLYEVVHLFGKPIIRELLRLQIVRP